ncbi:MAG: sigma-70 family RNA polymerase sigma factor [Ardenticatenaceae bacterium]|nr:sigma-70 family RNA polymerase sigma factor [Ardenticatenaceae bacterium]
MPFSDSTYASATDAQLLQGCLNGDEDAWARVLEKYERLVFSVALNTGLSHDDAADITQLTFTILLQNLPKIRESERLGGWLATVAKRQAWRKIKRTSREEALPDDQEPGGRAILADHGMMEEQKRQEQMTWLLEGLHQLNQRCQSLLQALYLTYPEKSYDDVAAEMGMKVGSIGPTRIRCLKKLREHLQENIDS